MLCRVLFFDTRQTIDFAVCLRKGTRQSIDLPSVKAHGKVKLGIFVVPHGKARLCRVPGRKHTANNETHGKHRFSGSVGPIRIGYITSYDDSIYWAGFNKNLVQIKL